VFNEIFTQKDMINYQEVLKKNHFTVTSAESCTGGLIASKITEISGSSEIFKGSIVTYSNDIKEQELGVLKNTMVKFGVVSCEVVEEMLLGVIKKFNSDFAIAVSGVAGPTGGTKDKPVGTVAIGVMDKNKFKNIQLFYFKGNRKEIQEQASQTALKLNFEILLKKA